MDESAFVLLKYSEFVFHQLRRRFIVSVITYGQAGFLCCWFAVKTRKEGTDAAQHTFFWGVLEGRRTAAVEVGNSWNG